jgi:hypothetical protein
MIMEKPKSNTRIVSQIRFQVWLPWELDVIIKSEGCPVTCHAGTQGRQKYSFYPYSTSAIKQVWCSRPLPSPFTPGSRTRYPLYRRLGEYGNWPGWVWNILVPWDFKPWAVKPVASRCMDHDIPAGIRHYNSYINRRDGDEFLLVRDTRSTNFVCTTFWYKTRNIK